MDNKLKMGIPVEEKNFFRCLNFITSKESLPQCTIDVFINVCSAPIEQTFYNWIISKLPLTASYEEYVHAGAHLYYLQKRLNSKIGRDPYDFGVEDKVLLGYIFDEIKKRRKDSFNIEKESPSWDAFKNDVHKCYLTLHPTLSDDLSIDAHALYKTVSHRFADEATININELELYLAEYLGRESLYDVENNNSNYYEFMKRGYGVNGWVSSYNNLMKKHLKINRNANFKDRPPTKNELYYFCIACGLDINYFLKLRTMVQSLPCVNPNDYVDVNTNRRDGIIQSVLRDIDGWISRTLNRVGHCKDLLPSKLCEDVNETLKKNGYDPLYEHNEQNGKNKT